MTKHLLFFFFFLNDRAPPEISSFPLPDALPISDAGPWNVGRRVCEVDPAVGIERQRQRVSAPTGPTVHRGGGRENGILDASARYQRRGERERATLVPHHPLKPYSPSCLQKTKTQ